MFRYDRILAKSDPEVTLLQHIKECLSIFSKVLQWNGVLIDLMATQYGIDRDLLINRLFLTVAFHDIAKATNQFQAKVRNEKHDEKESHALSSISFLYAVIKNRPVILFKDASYYPELMSVATHHSKLSQTSFDDYDSRGLKNEYAGEDFFVNYYSMVNEQAALYNIPLWSPVSFDRAALNSVPADILKFEIIRSFDKNGFVNDRSNKARDVFMLFKSVLHYCDWIASSGDFEYKYASELNNSIFTQKMIAARKGFEAWSAFQLNSAAAADRDIFVQISTGFGKTEAAVLWAINKNYYQKIIFLLPTKLTTNKMWRRMSQFFGGHNVVGLSHSTAQYYLKDDDEIAADDVWKHSLYNRTFFKPVTVATVDQLIYSFFNWGHWVMTGAASYNAKIIIDEIHVYDAYTFGLILQAIECIRPFNTKFAIMSASLPGVLKNELVKVLPDYVLIEEPAHDENQRHNIEVRDSLIEDNIEDIRKHYHKGRKVLVVCNTIAKAREVFIKLVDIPAESKMLYHSQFILTDKIEKEELLEDIDKRKAGYIAVCTQIVEVSLDIDFDVLFTENAPIDAILKRLGRVNRKGMVSARISEWQFSPVIITRESEKSRKYVYKDLDNILSETYLQLSVKVQQKDGNLNEKDFRELVNNIYTEESLGQKYFDEIQSAKNFVKDVWKKVLKNVFTLNIEEAKLNEISSRKSDYITVEAITLKHFRGIGLDKAVAKKQFDVLSSYILKVPLYLVRESGFKKDKRY
jgi:CRISPR-associated endonuclease/helicase Cas3